MRETDPQGLTDQTGSADDVTVTEGANTVVSWTNRQAPPVVVVNLMGIAFQDPSGSSATTIARGTTIRWVRITGSHTVTPDGHSEFSSQTMTAGSVFENTFNTVGTFD